MQYLINNAMHSDTRSGEFSSQDSDQSDREMRIVPHYGSGIKIFVNRLYHICEYWLQSSK